MDISGSINLISVNCGMPRQVPWHGRSVTTSIYKQPVQGRVALRTLNLDGDRQADLSVHGGAAKAVYCYPLAHYEYWKAELPGRELPSGSFGENFTVDGLVDDSVHIGDRFAVGSAEVVVTQPRLPCYKLGIRFESDEMVKRFLASRRMGFYLAVIREGEVGAGDRIVLTGREPISVPVPWITRLYVTKNYSRDRCAAGFDSSSLA
jgi:MOSC domain-containing protein YiiM